MEIFVYADETEFKKDSQDLNTIIGSGILLCETPIINEIIHEALLNLENDLKNDINKNKSDLKTILRKSFHASSDGPKAHHHILEIINKYVSGNFKYSNFEKHLQNSWETIKSKEDTFRLTLGLASLEFFERPYDKITFIIEERQKFNKEIANKWIEEWYDDLDLHAYSQTLYLTYYPKIEIKLGNKTDPGLQIVDFLIWALNRSKRTVPDTKWIDLLKISFSTDFSSEKGPQSGGKYCINKGIPHFGRLDYPIKINEPNEAEFYQAYEIIEKTIRSLMLNIPNNIAHFQSSFDALNLKLNDSNHLFNYNTLKKIASLYIRIFDTLPVYESIKDSDVKSWDILLKSKKMAGLYLRRDLINGVRSADAIIFWRQNIIKTNPSFFAI
jgi:hypothetical protein